MILRPLFMMLFRKKSAIRKKTAFRMKVVSGVNLVCVTTVVLLAAGCSGPSSLVKVENLTDDESAVHVASVVDETLAYCREHDCGFSVDPGARVDTIRVDRANRSFEVVLNDATAQQPFRKDEVAALKMEIQQSLAPMSPGWSAQVQVLDVAPEMLVPNVFDPDGGSDSKRWPTKQAAIPLVTHQDRPWLEESNLYGRHVAVWPSHGWYYEGRLDRWEWQRARLFQTVEDVFPMSFVVPYLAPMLERAGAFVHMPRERDVQPNEVVVDNDGQIITARPDLTPDRDPRNHLPPDASNGNRYLEVAESEEAWRTASNPGFMPLDTLRTENPFEKGTHRFTRTSQLATASITWIPDIPEAGDYAVHVSFGRTDHPTPDARYAVHHAGGVTNVRVNQQMMAGTWVYLGTYPFEAGQNPEKARVVLTNESDVEGRTVSADAVRFGGGMGSVLRGEQLSERPRFTEGARYFMQYAGFPDALVYNVTESDNDYVDDYRSRAEWVNYLRGGPLGPNKNREADGLGVPVDLSLAFHTDAGITKSDATIGTLMIYSSTGMEGERDFPSGFSRFANRDLGDGMQTQIVDDIRALYDSTWTRRAIWDRDYSEAVRPNVPGVLLELLSHQNFADMRFGLDPRFRFDVSRSIYKSMVRFMADQYGFDAIIQPLAPDHLQARWDGDSIELTWRAVEDPLEPSASPDRYVVYTRTAESGFDNGRVVEGTAFSMNGAESGVVYGFRVAALNEGGESAPSETVAVARAARGADTALIVSAFDRVSAPGVLEAGRYSGFAGWVDEGVPDGRDLSFIGDQYDFNMDSPWLDDDSPGHGASWSTWETRTRVGNTRDYPIQAAAALLYAGLNTETISDEAFVDARSAELDSGLAVVLFGEERRTQGPGDREEFQAMPPAFRAALQRHLEAGGTVFLSGAHVATDAAGPEAEEASVRFARDVLGFVWRTDRAVETGNVKVLPEVLDAPANLQFNTDPMGPVYRVEHPDALDPADAAESLMRYGDNNMSAGVGIPGRVVVLGFPFETVLGASGRALLMKAIVEYLR